MTSFPTSSPESRLAPVWQQRFAFFDQFGLPNNAPEARAAFQKLRLVDKMRLNSNVLAFIFGPFYFFAKGMWRKGLTLLLVGLALGLVIAVAGWSYGVLRFVSIGMSVVSMMTANYAYYLHVRRGSTSWNPYEGFGRPR